MLRAPKVSVAMPVYNPDLRYLREAIASVLSQTLGDLELVIVEDPGETTAAGEVAAFGDQRVVYVRNPRRTSLSDQRNAAIRLCRADWIAQLDADDVCEPDRLEEQLAFARQHPEVDVIGSQLRIIDRYGSTIGFRRYPLRHREIVGAMPRYNAVANPAALFRSRVVYDVGLYRPRGRAEDYDLWSRVALAGARFATHPRPLLRYRLHADGSKSSAVRAQLKDTLRVKRQLWSPRWGAGGWLRYGFEQGLLMMPEPWVLSMFKAAAYRRTLR